MSAASAQGQRPQPGYLLCHDMPDGDLSKHPTWMGVGKIIVPFLVGVISTAFVVGSARQKVQDVVKWKEEMAPRIERMDSQGTLSFSHFHVQYEKEQAHQYERLKELEKESRQIETMKLKIESLERALLDRRPLPRAERERGGQYAPRHDYVTDVRY
jgi:hypothetical protein